MGADGGIGVARRLGIALAMCASTAVGSYIWWEAWPRPLHWLDRYDEAVMLGLADKECKSIKTEHLHLYIPGYGEADVALATSEAPQHCVSVQAYRTYSSALLRDVPESAETYAAQTKGAQEAYDRERIGIAAVVMGWILVTGLVTFVATIAIAKLGRWIIRGSSK